MIKNNKRIFAIITLNLIILAIFTGCMGGEVKQTNEELNLLYEGDNANVYFREALNEYRTLYPNVKINLEEANVDITADWRPQYAKQLATDVMAGKGPDVIQLSLLVGGYDIEYSALKMISSGVFADISELYDNDTSIDREDLYSSVMEAGVFNGKRYIIPTTFQVPVLVTNQNLIVEAGIDLSKCNTYNNFIDETTPFIEKWQSDNTILRCFGRERAVSPLYYHNGLKYLDFENQKININGEEFKKWMDYWKLVFSQVPYPAQVQKEAFWGGPDPSDPTCNGFVFEDLTLHPGGIYFTAAVKEQDKPIILPLFNDDGTLPIKMSELYGVNASSENKENAWNFIKIMLDKKFFETEKIQFTRIPVSKSAAKNKLRDIDETQKNNYLEALENTSTEEPFFDPAQKIVMDSMMPFFKGEKAYEVCLKELKEKWELYVSE